MKENHRNLSSFLSLTVFCLFAACVLGVLLSGARVYKTITEQGAERYRQRTADQYITTRVHQTPGADAWEVMMLEDVSVLALKERIGEKTYITYVYCHDGFLRELFVSADYPVDPEDGERLTELRQAVFTKENGYLAEDLAYADGSSGKLHYAVRTGEVGK